MERLTTFILYSMLKNLKNTKSEVHFNLISPLLDDSIYEQPLKKFRNPCAIVVRKNMGTP